MYNDEVAGIIEYHHSMISDQTRTTAFLKAILETVQPGDVVLDIGTGTGVLASFACIAGARHVYAVEHGAVAELARRVIDRNGFGDRVTVMNDWSTDITLPVRADVLITETIGNLGFDEGILGWVIDARRRLLAPNARLIPQTVDFVIAPIESPRSFHQIDHWSPQVYALDYTPVREVAANNIYWAEISPAGLLAEPAVAISVDLREATRRSGEGNVTFTATRPGLVHGLGGWFRSRLSRGVSLDTDPPLKARSWNNGFFPLVDPVEVAAGDHLTVTMRMADNGGCWEWAVTTPGRPDPGAAHGTARGSLLDDGRLLPLDHRPQRTGDAALDGFTLNLIDGEATVAEIAAALRTAFPERLSSDDRAVAHVEDVVLRYPNSSPRGRPRS